MSGNRSLDEFAGSGAGDSSGGEAAESGPADDEPDPGSVRNGNAEDAADDSEGAQDDPDGSADEHDAAGDPGNVEPDREAPEPPASTYVWRPGGGTCAGCGEAVDERWRDGEDLVCAGCKEW